MKLKSFFLILLSLIILLVAGFISSLIINSRGELAIVKLKDQEIYLRHVYQGLSSECNTISNRRWGKANNITDNYGGAFFYKIDFDTLFIYGGTWKHEDFLMQNLPIIHVCLDFDESYQLEKVYESKQLNVFPPSYEAIIKNNRK